MRHLLAVTAVVAGLLTAGFAVAVAIVSALWPETGSDEQATGTVAPCPRCGRSPDITEEDGVWRIGCRFHGSVLYSGSRAAAVAFWGRYTAPERRPR